MGLHIRSVGFHVTTNLTRFCQGSLPTVPAIPLLPPEGYSAAATDSTSGYGPADTHPFNLLGLDTRLLRGYLRGSALAQQRTLGLLSLSWGARNIGVPTKRHYTMGYGQTARLKPAP